MTESDTQKSTKNVWSVRLTSNEEKELLAKAFAAVCGLQLIGGWGDVLKKPTLTTIFDRETDGLNKQEIIKNFGTETIVKEKGRKGHKTSVTETKVKEIPVKKVFEIPVFDEIYERLKKNKFYGMLFYKPSDKTPNMKQIAKAEFVPTKATKDGEINTEDAVAVINKILESQEFEKPDKKDTKSKNPKTVTLDQSTIDAINKKEPSMEEQIKNTVTKIAKNRELMNLSKEQLKDYLRDAYEISDENALNNMMNAVVAKRAELLANKQLKQEELTEIDISKLQEQSQRDFEKKLQDQNLRYILPAQIEKRERLAQNRLNPELLKGGY